MAHVIEIFRSGRHVSASGEVVNFTDADLDAIIRAYDPAVHEAPVVVGHPRADAPAYGWAKSLSRSGSVLRSTVDDLDTSFTEHCLKKKRFKKVSASFYKPDSESNPKPGAYYLRHIGFLGAQPPAVKGLREASFSDADDCVTIDFADGEEDETQAIADAVNVDTPLGKLRAWLIKMFGQAQADEALPLSVAQAADALPAAADTTATTETAATVDAAEADDVIAKVAGIEGLTAEQLEAIKRILSEAFAAPATPAATAPVTSPTVDAAERDPVLRAKRADLAKREADLRKREREARRREDMSFLEGLLREGRTMPCSRTKVLAFLELFEGITSTVSFGEGESRTPAQIFRDDFLAHLPRQVNFDEVTPGDFAESDDDVTVAKAAQAYQAAQAKQGNHISTTEALNAVKGKTR